MSRLHIHLTVRNIEQNIRFYSALFNHAPTVEKPDYAKWELADPAVNFAISIHGARAGLDHVGIQTDDAAELRTLRTRLKEAGIDGREQSDATCCYARSDKYWSRDPQGIAWETFHTHDSHPTFGGATEKNTTGCCLPAFGTVCC